MWLKGISCSRVEGKRAHRSSCTASLLVVSCPNRTDVLTVWVANCTISAVWHAKGSALIAGSCR